MRRKSRKDDGAAAAHNLCHSMNEAAARTVPRFVDWTALFSSPNMVHASALRTEILKPHM
jgi:hypothetical protein